MDDEDRQSPRQDERRNHGMIGTLEGRIVTDHEHVDEMMAIKGHEGDETDEVDADLTGQAFQTLGSVPRGVGSHEWASCSIEFDFSEWPSAGPQLCCQRLILTLKGMDCKDLPQISLRTHAPRVYERRHPPNV